jgi:hypothetical protein
MSRTKQRKQQNKTIKEKDLDQEFDELEEFVKIKKKKKVGDNNGKENQD